MKQLIYISTARGELSPEVVDQILKVSRRNNSRDGLTGLLVVGHRRFLQVLEGPSPVLDAAYRRIRADPRHYAFVELARKSIDMRSFPDWEMGYQDAGNRADVEGLVSIVERLTERIADPSLKAELRSFAEIQIRAA